MARERLLASLGSALANLTLFGSVVAGWPGLPPWTGTAYAGTGGVPVVVRVGFSPYIVQSDGNGWRGQTRERCPQPAVSAWQVDILSAPLPAGFDPGAWPGERRYACVRVDRAGKVLDVSLIGVDEPALAAALTEKIRRDWSLVSRDWAYTPPDEWDGGWARVRINAGLPEAPTMPPPQTY